MVKYSLSKARLPAAIRRPNETVLCDNDIGYKTQEDKMFIRRYYLFLNDSLLETVATTISSDKNRLRQALDEEHFRALGRDAQCEV